MNRLERLKSEFRSADEVLLALVAFGVRRAAAPSPAFDLPADDLARVAVAEAAALSRVIRWRAGHPTPLGLVARQAVADAVAADTVRDRFPAEAARLERPWRTAVRVRARLRVLGPEAEAAALRMLPTWLLPLEELPDVAGALTPCGSGSDYVRPQRRQAGSRAVAATSAALVR